MTPGSRPLTEVTWRWVTFDELTVDALYRVMALRQRVFVIEQNCVYLDADGHDAVCIHGLGESGGELVAYARLLPRDVAYPTPSIGRVVTSPTARGSGLGRTVVEQAIAECGRRFPGEAITIGAQLYLLAFYESFGFVGAGNPYDEDGIMHIEMIRTSSADNLIEVHVRKHRSGHPGR